MSPGSRDDPEATKIDYPYTLVQIAEFLHVHPATLEGPKNAYWVARTLEYMNAKAKAQERYQAAIDRRQSRLIGRKRR